jgi:formamidopyrimidine-DNA glycosylase
LRAAPGAVETFQFVPELPEVEAVRAALADELVGLTIVDGFDSGASRFAGAGECRGLVELVSRRGKWLVMTLRDAPGDTELVVHLGMTGKITVSSGDEATCADPGAHRPRHLHARWVLRDAHRVRIAELYDPRRFGRAVVVPPGEYTTLPGLARLGAEPGTPGAASALEAGCRSTRAVKAVLLDQSVIAGVGNIYADEALWAAGIAPHRRACTLEPAERSGLASAVADAINAGLDHGGTTLRDYRRPDGSAGSHQDHLACYGRAGSPCRRCGELLKSSTVAGRTSTWCATCQA